MDTKLIPEMLIRAIEIHNKDGFNVRMQVEIQFFSYFIIDISVF